MRKKPKDPRGERAARHSKSPNSAELARIVPLNANVKGFGPQRRVYDDACRYCMESGEMPAIGGGTIPCPHCRL